MANKIQTFFIEELASYHNAKFKSEDVLKWHHLERAHIIGQTNLAMHFKVHLLKLKESIVERNVREFKGQVFRILLVPLGHLVGILPSGNVGSSRVSAFKEMDIPKDIQNLF